jgi:hypothetical protein
MELLRSKTFFGVVARELKGYIIEVASNASSSSWSENIFLRHQHQLCETPKLGEVAPP